MNVEPHSYRPLSLLDRFIRQRCRHCYWPGRAHPIHYWVVGRIYGDKRFTDERFAADIEFAQRRRNE